MRGWRVVWVASLPGRLLSRAAPSGDNAVMPTRTSPGDGSRPQTVSPDRRVGLMVVANPGAAPND
jgi:hypothetical protein